MVGEWKRLPAGHGKAAPSSVLADGCTEGFHHLTTLPPVLSVLLVADEPWVIADVGAVLSDGRYAVTVVSDPRTVAESVAANPVDVVLVDLQVGSMGGMAVTRSVRDAASVAGRSAPPVILLLDRDADSFLAGRSGASGSVRKPFGSAELRAAIEKSVSSRS